MVYRVPINNAHGPEDDFPEFFDPEPKLCPECETELEETSDDRFWCPSCDSRFNGSELDEIYDE